MHFCILALTDGKLDFSPEFFKVHRITADKIKDFRNLVLMPVRYHFIGAVNGAQDLGKRLILIFYRLSLSYAYIYRRIRRTAREIYSPGFGQEILIIFSFSHFFAFLYCLKYYWLLLFKHNKVSNSIWTSIAYCCARCAIQKSLIMRSVVS